MIELNKRLHQRHAKFNGFLHELNDKNIPSEIAKTINGHLGELNSFSGSGSGYSRLLRKKQWKIVTLLEKELKIVPKNYYRNLWMILGMSAIGLPIGIALGIALQQMGLMGAGVPFGMAVGIAIGSVLDKKAKEKGKQLDFEMS